MPITTQENQPNNPQQQATGNGFSLPEVPQFDRYQQYSLQTTPGDMSRNAQLTRAYQQYYGRDPNAGDFARYNNMSGGQFKKFINAIPTREASRTIGRARNEAGALINSQIGQVEREAQLSRLRALEEMGNSEDYYTGQLGNLDFQRDQQETSIETALQQLYDESDFGAQRLQQQINPAILGARSGAARSGLLNSTIALDRINQSLNPISQGLVDLERKRQTGAQGLNQQRTDLLNRYAFQKTDLMGEQGRERKQIEDQVALLMEQAQQQAAQLLTSANPTIWSRAGELQDSNREFGIQEKTLSQDMRQFLLNLSETRRQFDLTPKK